MRRLFLLSGVLTLGCPGAGSSSAGVPPAEAPTAQATAAGAPDAASAAAPSLTERWRNIVASADRSDDDRKLDAGRKPVEVFAFFGVQPGYRVAELGAGTGYTAELLARGVAPNGKVYAQNSKFILERFAEKPWSERLAKPVMSNVVRVDREFDDPLPPEASGLDAVFMILFYHDTVWFETDRAKMNKAIFEHLKPGGVFAIVDHNAAEGAGTSATKPLHRIEESVVKQEVQAAGFVLAEESDVLRNPDDPRDWNDSPSASAERRGTSDRFVLKFKRPE